jgi:hypothetical protein
MMPRYDRAGEGHAEVPELQGHEGRAAVRRLHGSDVEEELTIEDREADGP